MRMRCINYLHEENFMNYDFFVFLIKYFEENQLDLMLTAGWNEEEFEKFRSGLCNICYSKKG